MPGPAPLEALGGPWGDFLGGAGGLGGFLGLGAETR